MVTLMKAIHILCAQVSVYVHIVIPDSNISLFFIFLFGAQVNVHFFQSLLLKKKETEANINGIFVSIMDLNCRHKLTLNAHGEHQ